MRLLSDWQKPHAGLTGIKVDFPSLPQELGERKRWVSAPPTWVSSDRRLGIVAEKEIGAGRDSLE